MSKETENFVIQNIGKQPGDSVLSAKIIVNVVRGKGFIWKGGAGTEGDWPDLNMLVLGSDALTNIRDKCERILRSLNVWESVARSIDIKE